MDSGVSIVVPVYNAGRYLGPCLDSLTGQDIDRRLVEVIAVDDGSTDGSAETLDEYAARDPRIRVIRQANSGGPGRPRNVGIDASDREYVFFADADDYLGPQAVRRMYEFANRHGSDVVSPRIVGNGRFVHARAWARTQVDADLKLAFLSYSPQKLFRTSFLREQNLRFREGKARFEDGVFVSRAYLTASRVSLLGGYDYYIIRLRDDSGNRSHGASDPHGYVDSQCVVIDTIRRLCPDRELAEYLVLDLYRRKTLKPFAGNRFPRWSQQRRRDCVDAARNLATSRIPVELDSRLPFPYDVRSHLAREGDVDALLDQAIAVGKSGLHGRVANGRVIVDLSAAGGRRAYDATEGLHVQAELERVGRGSGELFVHGRARIDAAVVDGLDFTCVLRERTSGAERVIPIRRQRVADDGWVVLDATVPSTAFPAEPPPHREIWSLLVRPVLGGEARPEARFAVRGSPSPADAAFPAPLPIRRRRFAVRPYATAYGNLAFRVESHGMSPTRRGVRILRMAPGVVRRRLRRAGRR